ncbi:hypothetical protein [Chitinophaga eiseniae]|nr:hypothetical protein [Chitinophaga eiseniae]
MASSFFVAASCGIFFGSFGHGGRKLLTLRPARTAAFIFSRKAVTQRR